MIPLPLDRLINFRNISEALHEFIELLDAVLFIGELTTAHDNRYFDHVTFGQEFTTAGSLAIQVSGIRTKAKANCLHFGLLTVGFLEFLFLLEFIEIAPVFAKLHDRWHRLRGYFNQIETLFFGTSQGISNCHTLRCSVLGDEENFGGANLFINFRTSKIERARGSISLSHRKSEAGKVFSVSAKVTVRSRQSSFFLAAEYSKFYDPTIARTLKISHFHEWHRP